MLAHVVLLVQNASRVMPIVPQHPSLGTRVSLLVCDACDGVLAHDGSTSAKPHRESAPEDVAAHYDSAATLRGIARSSGWTGDASTDSWVCARCSVPPPPK